MFEEVDTIDDSFTLSYSFDEEGFMSFHDYIPDCIFTHRNNNLYSYKEGVIYQHNVGEYGNFYDKKFDSYVQPTFAPNIEKNRAFITGSVNWVTEAENRNTTFTQISFRNSIQNTGEIPLVVYDDKCSLIEQRGKFNIRRDNNRWFFNNIKVSNKDCKTRKQPFIDDYIIAKLTFDNKAYLKFYSIDFNVQLV